MAKRSTMGITCSCRERGYSSHSQRCARNFCDLLHSSFDLSVEWGEDRYSAKVCWHFGVGDVQELGSGGGVGGSASVS